MNGYASCSCRTNFVFLLTACSATDPEQNELRDALAEYVSVDRENIICGAGSDEILELLFKLLEPRSIVTSSPTFSVYRYGTLDASRNHERIVLNCGQDERIKSVVKLFFAPLAHPTPLPPKKLSGSVHVGTWVSKSKTHTEHENIRSFVGLERQMDIKASA